ncbi:MAG: hypothetical protein K6F84_05250 [Lachnospiraceae bacterium]|nr:hypothetical protein [Lachnospiraceae bacterium]
MSKIRDFYYIFLASVNIDPMKIATEANGGKTTIHEYGERDLFYFFGLNGLFSFLKTQGLIIATIMVLIAFISMLFINRSDKLADKKADVIHKLKIVFIICSLLWILDLFVLICDSIF